MLSPLRPSVPSTSLLRYLRSQTGSANGSSVCVHTRPRDLCHEIAATGSSRRSSGWARPGRSEGGTTPEAGFTSTTGTRPRFAHPASSSGRSLFVRHTSTTRRPLLRRLFDLKRGKGSEHKNTRLNGPALIDDGTEGVFNIGRGLAAKASNELRIRCTEFDMNGNVTLVNGEFRKLELIAKVGHQYLTSR